MPFPPLNPSPILPLSFRAFETNESFDVRRYKTMNTLRTYRRSMRNTLTRRLVQRTPPLSGSTEIVAVTLICKSVFIDKRYHFGIFIPLVVKAADDHLFYQVFKHDPVKRITNRNAL